MPDVPAWEEEALDLDTSGRIVDYLDPTRTRSDTGEERVRQRTARILVEEYGYSRECMKFEARVDIGSSHTSADIAIYDSPESRAAQNQGRIRLVIETKQPTKAEGHGQLISYIFASSAGGGMWTNGDEIAYYRRLDAPEPHLDEWTNIPRDGETWDTVGHYSKADLRPPRNLKHVFRRCHNVMYRLGDGSEDIAYDMVRIILAKYEDEGNPGDTCEFRCTPEEYATPEGRRAASRRVQKLFRQVADEYPGVFSSEERITITEDGLANVISQLQLFRFLADTETEEVYDVIGTAFEVYVAAHLIGERGQYFTNRLIANLMVSMINPTESDTALDPSCGSAGFLISTLKHVRGRVASSTRNAAAKRRALKAVEKRLFGIDISPKLVKVAKTNMVLHGDGHGGIAQGNSLKPLTDLPGEFGLYPKQRGRVRPTVILANPPFGASHDKRIRERTILTNFDLGHTWRAGEDEWLRRTDDLNDGDGVPPEILFLERCIRWLKPGGRMAIVLARGVLDNRDALPARQYVLKHTKMLGVFNCHPHTFQPYNGTRAAVLVLEKKAKPGFQHDEDFPVFMAINQRIGQDSMGREIYLRDKSGGYVLSDDKQRVPDHDMADLSAAWQAFRAGRDIEYDAAWTVPLSRILESPDWRFNPVRYAPKTEAAMAYVLDLALSDEWRVERLGDIARVFNGPRFKRPYADEGAAEGDEGILRYYTPGALFEERGKKWKLLDRAKASPAVLRHLDALMLERDWIMIVDSGTVGGVTMTTSVHEGTVGSNNLIRVVIEDPVLRGYVYGFLHSALGQDLVLRERYGTIQEHIEPRHVQAINIPIPTDRARMRAISQSVRQAVKHREKAAMKEEEAKQAAAELLPGPAEEPEEEGREEGVATTRGEFYRHLEAASAPQRGESSQDRSGQGSS